MASESDLYVSLVEVEPLPGCQLDYSQFAGAAVRCYLTARSEGEAIARIRDSLARDAFAVVDIRWCVQSKAVQWENPDDTTAANLANEAITTGEVVYGEFHVWAHDAPDLK